MACFSKYQPKQFLKLTGDQTMLQATLSPLDGIEHLDSPIILCNEEHRFTTAEQLNEMDLQIRDIILEPIGKNTATALAIGALRRNNILTPRIKYK